MAGHSVTVAHLPMRIFAPPPLAVNALLAQLVRAGDS